MLRSAAILFGLLAMAIAALAATPHAGAVDVGALAARLPAWTNIPFVVLLACLALAPMAAPRIWEKNSFKLLVCAGLAAPVVAYLGLAGTAGGRQLLVQAHEYVSFICLLISLYVISGGILVRGAPAATPTVNTALLGVGALLANLFGTTGASMLLVRPLLRANTGRPRQAHLVVFFIFVVGNCGGMLSPLGDPPLFLGFLKGVPFGWTPRALLLPWLFLNGALLAIFHVWDRARFRADRSEVAPPRPEALHLEGGFNLALIAGVTLLLVAAGRGLLHGGRPWPFGWQEGGMLALAAISLGATAERVHRDNGFALAPIEEVAVVFAGIFATMAPVLVFLNARGASLGIARPWQFFWTTGALSSLLDNAPTYLAFAAVACGLHGVPAEGQYLAALLGHEGGAKLLQAISAGAVSMGALTYIGNGPNFLVKALAKHQGVEAPSFVGYLGYSLPVLLPLFAAATLLFFRG